MQDGKDEGKKEMDREGGREARGKIKGKDRRGLVAYRQAGIKRRRREVLTVPWLFGCCPLSKIDSMITYRGQRELCALDEISASAALIGSQL